MDSEAQENKGDWKTESGALKHRKGKSAVHLIPPDIIIEEGYAFAYGAEKYGVDNWRKGIPWREYIGAAMRHILRFACGEECDAEASRVMGRPIRHLSLARACLAMLQSSDTHEHGNDDRV